RYSLSLHDALPISPENKPLDALQCAGKRQLAEHPIDTVGFLTDIFQKEDAIGEVGIIPGACQPREHGKVSAQQLSFSRSRAQRPYRPLICRIHWQTSLKEKRLELIKDHRRPPAVRHRTMEGNQSGLRVDSLMESGDVAITHKDFRIACDKSVIQFVKQPRAPRSAA